MRFFQNWYSKEYNGTQKTIRFLGIPFSFHCPHLEPGFSLENKKKYIRRKFVYRVGYEPQFDSPRSFNEKLQWLKLHYHNPLMTQCADKFRVRDYIQEKIGSPFLVDLIGVYDKPEEIDFDSLPEKFVLKVNWGSHQNIICTNKSKLNIPEAIKKLNVWLRPCYNHYFRTFEWAYKNIQPKILCEKYLETNGEPFIDIRFHCFNGEPKIIMYVKENLDSQRYNFYDLNWNLLPFGQRSRNIEFPIERPEYLDEMLSIAKKLSAPFPNVRVDLYHIQNKIQFAELTFYDGSGLDGFTPVKWDFNIGKMLALPEPLLEPGESNF